MKFLVVVDMQKDFVDGALGTAEAQAIVPAVVAKIETAKANGDRVFVTMDTHGEDYMQTQEGKNLPVPHCIKDTDGWRLDASVAGAIGDAACAILEKPTFGATKLPETLRQAMENVGQPDEIEFIGLCTGICVISNVLLTKAAFPELPVTVDAACCACVTPASHQTALQAMALCQVGIKNG